MNQVRFNLVKILTLYLTTYRNNSKEIKQTLAKTREFRIAIILYVRIILYFSYGNWFN